MSVNKIWMCKNCGHTASLSLRAMKQRSINYPEHVGLCRSCFSKKLIILGHKKGWVDYNAGNSGKSFEDRFGKVKSRAIKRKLASHPGPWLGKSITPAMKSAISLAHKGKRLSESHKRKLSKAFSGSGNPMFGKPAPKGSGRSSCSGHFGGVYFRSLSELSFLVSFPTARSAEHLKINFRWKNRDRTYRPDFILGSCIYEIKPAALVGLPLNRVKFKAAKAAWKSRFVVKCPGIDYPWVATKEIDKLVESEMLRFTRYADQN